MFTDQFIKKKKKKHKPKNNFSWKLIITAKNHKVIKAWKQEAVLKTFFLLKSPN